MFWSPSNLGHTVEKNIPTPYKHRFVVVFDTNQRLRSAFQNDFYFERQPPEVLVGLLTLFKRQSLSLSLSPLAHINTDCLSTCRLSVARPAGWEHPRAQEVSPDFWKRTGRRDITLTARQTCAHSGSHSCCFGLSGATPALSAEKVGTREKKEDSEKA